MRESLKVQCETFIHNRDEIKSYFKWDNVCMISVCASEFCSKNIKIDVETLLECKNILEKSAGVFSTFRGNGKLPIISMLAADENPEERMKKALEIHEILKLRFRSSQYLAMVATILSGMIDVDQAEECVDRAKDIYNLMKKEHPFLTAGEDSVFAVLLAFAYKTDEELIEDMEECYKTMKKFSSDSNAMQSLSHVLALSQSTPEVICERVLSMHKALAEAGCKYGKGYEMAVLGALAVLPVDANIMLDDVKEVDDFLATQKGYGGLGIDKKTRLMHAVMLVADDYAQKNIANTAAITGTMAMIAAQQAAMCSIIAVSAVT